MIPDHDAELAERLAGPGGETHRRRLIDHLAALERELAGRCARPTTPGNFTKLQAARLAVQAAAATLRRIDPTFTSR